MIITVDKNKLSHGIFYTTTLLHSNRKYLYYIKNSTKIYKSEYCQQM